MRLLAQTVMESPSTANAAAPYYTDANPSPEGQPTNAAKIALARRAMDNPTLDIFSPVDFENSYVEDSGGICQVGMYIADLRVQFLTKLLDVAPSLDVPSAVQIQWQAMRNFNLHWAIKFRIRVEMDFANKGDKYGKTSE